MGDDKDRSQMEMNYDGNPYASPEMGGMDVLQPGTVIGSRFEVKSKLGSGGFGHLYQALDRESQKPVALRALAGDICQDESVFDLVRAQVKSASSLQHKNIGSVFGMGKERNVRFIAMEFVEGRSLRFLLNKKRTAAKTFSLKGAYNVLAHVCNALHHAHETMLHGMPGPGSILINRVGRVKVCEFGIIRALPPGSNITARLGDRYCLAPEMESDPASAGPAADIYSLGVILYELLTGRPPPSPDVPPSSVVLGLTPAVDAVVARCLQPFPADRYASAREVKAAFYEALQEAGESADVSQPVPAQAQAVPAQAQAPQSRPAAPVAAPPEARQSSGPVDPFTIPRQQPSQPPPAQPAVPKPAAAKQVSIEELLSEVGDDTEKWLIQKDRLDFGPFAMSDLKQQLYKQEFSGDDVVVDQESGERAKIRSHPAFRDFMIQLDRHFENKRMAQADIQRSQQDKRRRSILIGIVFGCLAILAAGGAVAVYLIKFRNPETREKIVYREKEANLGKLLRGIDITWKKEPEDQAKRRRRIRKRRRRTGSKGGSDVTTFDMSKEGGDALLTQRTVQRIMAQNFSKLKGCVIQAVRRNPGLKAVIIEFGIRGTGSVSSIKVNTKSRGPFHSCISRKMRTISFPKFDGQLTRASFSMNLSY